MCDEILATLSNDELGHLKKRVNHLIVAVKDLLMETGSFPSAQEQKSWISSLILSLSKKNKTWSNNPTPEEIDEISVMIGGLSDATHDLFKLIGNDETRESISLSSASASDRIRGSLRPLIEVDVTKYPSPQSSDGQFNLNRFPLVNSMIVC